jgi:hypothetical protein
MSTKATVEMESKREIRNGYMALVISVSTKLQTKYDPGTEENKDAVVTDYLDNTGGEEWRAFVDDELKKSNENNNKTLGGCTRNSMSEDNDEGGEGNYDVQMEKIMQRFTNFNQILSETSGQDDDDDDEDEDTQEYVKGEIGEEEDGDADKNKDKDENTPSEEYATKVTPVKMEETVPLTREYSDAEFWNIGKKEKEEEEIDYDALLAELDS